MQPIFKKIMIFGRPGSGKSTFAYQLQQATNFPLYHLDKYFFTANWQQRPTEEFLATQQQLVDQQSWIIDGNSTRSLEMRYARAEVCIYFNYSKYVCLWRIFKRLLEDRSHLDDRAEDCPEQVRWHLIKYMWTFQDRVKDTIAALRVKYPAVHFIEITNNQQASECYDYLTNSRVNN